MQVTEAAPSPSGGGSPVALLGLTALVVGGVLFAKQTQPTSDSKNSGGGGGQNGGGGGAPSPPKGAAASNGGQAPQSAGACVY